MLLHRAFTLGTPRRVSASSITSSWYSDPRCTSSTDAPPVTAFGSSPRRSPVTAYAAHKRERRAEALPAGAEQVGGHVAEEPVVDPDRGLERFFDPAQVFGQRQEAEVVDEPHRRAG